MRIQAGNLVISFYESEYRKIILDTNLVTVISKNGEMKVLKIISKPAQESLSSEKENRTSSSNYIESKDQLDRNVMETSRESNNGDALKDQNKHEDLNMNLKRLETEINKLTNDVGTLKINSREQLIDQMT